MAEVVSLALYGDATPSAKAEAGGAQAQTKPAGEKNKRSMSSMILLIVLVIVGVILFALLQTGGGKSAAHKIGRNLSEMTGGLIGRKRDKKE